MTTGERPPADVASPGDSQGGTGGDTAELTGPGASVLVAGLGVTGAAVVAALTGLGVPVSGVDRDLPDDMDIPLFGADAAMRALAAGAYSLVVASPGWAPSHPVLQAAAAAGVPIWSEVELAWRLRVPAAVTGRPAPWLAVTGTNGKTTTVGMTEAIVAAQGHTVRAVGNVGTPLITAALDPSLEIIVVELSSFQLHFTSSMSPLAAVVLNVAADHLDWHGSFEAYAAAKASIYQRVQVACVYPRGDDRVRAMVEAADVVDGAVAVGVTTAIPGPGDIGVVDGLIVDRAFHAAADSRDRQRTALELASFADLSHLAGPDGRLAEHTWNDALAAIALARAAGVSPAGVAAGLRAFHPGHHRIEVIAAVADVRYVDDSKATNGHAAQASLLAFPGSPVVWIAGGLAKGAQFDELVAAVAPRLRAVVLIGRDPEPMLSALSRHAPDIPVYRIDPGQTETVMSRAVNAASRAAQPGDTVLLAPACASMDQFRSYADRGAAFGAAVASLGDTAASDAL